MDDVKEWTLHDNLTRVWGIIARDPILRGHPVMAHLLQEPDFFLMLHPILCGILKYNLYLQLHGTGVHYNAGKHLHVSTRVFYPKYLFFNGLPKTLEYAKKKLMIAIGASAINFAKNRRPARVSDLIGLEWRSNSSLLLRIMSEILMLVHCGRHKGNLLGYERCEHSGSTECLSIAREWLYTCATEHHRHQCSRPLANEHELPTRVIAVGPLDGSRDPFPMDPPTGSRGEWAALSYCCGPPDEHRTMLRVDNISKYRQSIPMHTIPATIRDAITVTRNLGLLYLWVYSFSIYSYRPALNNLGLLRFAPHLSEGLDLTHLASQVRQCIF
ncbi:uncharacterized protein BDZ99DRAFT_207507 [Mytilinidion resinicola]|uniref:Heterokaryon incompatibility domain-containing protein n=1 Tax=Mytilinidion resinicola TaxID=574789 RepID=A0A6A6Y0V0_9PEZI|nr:uncharacterized protein BDZ99DRAFT_207507 [Mytilinidion resinicola]KAF2802279.1 hypothetical protein BDZ99DRAFT_207507 [Mytilinidion resinicola]